MHEEGHPCSSFERVIGDEVKVQAPQLASLNTKLASV